MNLEEAIKILEDDTNYPPSLHEIEEATKVVLVELKKHIKLNEINESIINMLKFKVEILDQKINSFESGEMIIGGTYENKAGTHGKHCRECGRDECSL